MNLMMTPDQFGFWRRLWIRLRWRDVEAYRVMVAVEVALMVRDNAVTAAVRTHLFFGWSRLKLDGYQFNSKMTSRIVALYQSINARDIVQQISDRTLASVDPIHPQDLITGQYKGHIYNHE